ncbi:GNAT family N-acetyltransferase [Neoaquamicrobium sediminum]|uniref:GNAT family N-acetyltransferase n=1 Tax=Neoaquamicrobium sediminum TaxID=1849104 RepID=UPI001564AA08|nr:GNAT family N-acetyltransferase [Mesorhizobium sediminum]NRC53631.1 GNAT family N-acetyltransferase [Mesorhizobium sediminum]
MTAEQAFVAAFEAPPGYSIRAHRPADDAALLRIENRAAQLFRAHGYPEIADNPFASVDDFRAMATGHEVLVAVAGDDRPVGYAVSGARSDFLHLRELSVDPDHGRRGLGSALVRAVIARCLERALRGVTLTTFRTVPFNAPFYAALGFVELPLEQASAPLRDVFHQELPEGIAATSRVLMVHPC